VAAFDFDTGSLLLTEAGSKKRASLWVVAGDAGLAAQDPGGIEPLAASFEAFRAAFTRENHTLKRALCDPHILSGIGNAYSDEILHAARLSPVSLSQSLDEAALRRLYGAMREVLIHWRSRLLAEAAGELPARVTAFHPDMAVHGRFRKPCRVCGSPVQRIRYKSTETNYCANCQTGSRLLRDRALSRLLKADWPAALPPV
jgi:formamidopyrimidine-DNA glycosylase